MFSPQKASVHPQPLYHELVPTGVELTFPKPGSRNFYHPTWLSKAARTPNYMRRGCAVAGPIHKLCLPVICVGVCISLTPHLLGRPTASSLAKKIAKHLGFERVWDSGGWLRAGFEDISFFGHMCKYRQALTPDFFLQCSGGPKPPTPPGRIRLGPQTV